mgnify:CR=1 FL=1
MQKDKIYKTALLSAILAFLFFPVIQQQFKFVNLKPLSGAYIPKNYCSFSPESWLNESYQNNTNDYLNENFGFRNFLVTLNGQLRFSLFNKGLLKVVVGKENHLFISDYIETYYGKDFSEAHINDTISKLKFLNDTLRSLGKTLLVVLAPNKARVYPEFIPDYLKQEVTDKTNYSALLKGFKNSGIHYLDFNQDFINKKRSSPYLLFSQLGTHWSRLEALRSVDSIMGYLSWLTQTNLPRIRIKKVFLKDSLEFPDDDIAIGMNILFCPAHDKMAYPEFEYDTENKVKKNVLVVGDSYWQDIYFREIPKHLFATNEYWYFSKSSFGNFYFGTKEISNRDVVRTILQNDLIIIVCSESNFRNLGFGFAGAAYSAMKRPVYPTVNEIKKLKQIIRDNNNWIKEVELKALKRNISVDSMLSEDAAWAFYHYGPVRLKKTVYDIKEEMRKNNVWMNEIRSKAEKRNISIDSMMTLDAIWAHETLPPEEKETRKLSVNDIKHKIKNTIEWMSQIKIKAREKNISTDSMVTLDAIWFYNHQD